MLQKRVHVQRNVPGDLIAAAAPVAEARKGAATSKQVIARQKSALQLMRKMTAWLFLPVRLQRLKKS